MARYVFTAARRRALKKAQRASRAARRGKRKARVHHRKAKAHRRVRHHARRSHGRRKYVFTAARRRALKKAQAANRHHARAGRKGARIRKFKSELAGLGYGEYAVNPGRKTRRSGSVAGAGARLAKWRWHHNPATLAGDVLAGGCGIFTNPFRKGKVRATKRRIGKVFKRKGRYYIVSRLRNGVKVARPWSKRSRR
jgi:hypothetical protein